MCESHAYRAQASGGNCSQPFPNAALGYMTSGDGIVSPADPCKQDDAAAVTQPAKLLKRRLHERYTKQARSPARVSKLAADSGRRLRAE
jgi:hypothetical protein